MARLGPNPTVADAAQAYRALAAEVIGVAAGKDQRLSRSEAHRIAERLDGGRHLSVEAVDYLYSNDQKTVAAGKLIDALVGGFTAAAESVAGSGGRVSLPEGRQLPVKYRADFLYLRGHGPADPPERTREELIAVVKAAALEAIDSGAAMKLAMPPKVVKGRKPLFEQVPHPASNTRISAYIANNQIYLSRSANFPTPLVGWYKVGPVPPP